MNDITNAVELASERVLAEKKPGLHATIKAAILNDKLTPLDVDNYIKNKFGLPKGHPIRDVCYMTALYFQHNPQ